MEFKTLCIIPIGRKSTNAAIIQMFAQMEIVRTCWVIN